MTVSPVVDDPIISHPTMDPLQVQEVLGVVNVELRSEDNDENTLTNLYCSQGCTCTLGPSGQPCCSIFKLEHYRDYRAQCLEMTKEQLDLVILGQIAALTFSSTNLHNSSQHRHSPQERQRQYITFLHQHQPVCRKTFSFLHAVGEKRLKALIQHYRHHGLVPRVHGNTGKPRANALLLHEVKHAISFIVNYAESHAVVLPGRVPGIYKRSDLQLLPSSTTKKNVWLLYKAAAESVETRAATYSPFCKIWQKFLPQVLITTPLTNLCDVCYQFSGLQARYANCSEEEKSEVQ